MQAKGWRDTVNEWIEYSSAIQPDNPKPPGCTVWVNDKDEGIVQASYSYWDRMWWSAHKDYEDGIWLTGVTHWYRATGKPEPPE